MHKMPFSLHVGILGVIILAGFLLNNGVAQINYRIFVSNEKSGDISVINGSDFHIIKTIALGKRPRDIQTSSYGKTLYVALGGTPVNPPPQLDANGNPILQKYKQDDDNDIKAEKAADGIGMVDLTTDKFLRKIPAGSDPGQFAISLDGQRLYVPMKMPARVIS
jgi:YVTN family beta-propeller protein